MFPKTVILTIDSHGFYTVDKGEIDEKLIDVSNLDINSCIKNVYKINAVFLGVNNISTKITRSNTMKIIKNYVKKYNTQLQEFDDAQLDKFVLELRELLYDSNKEFVKSLENDVNMFKRKNINIENTKTFSDYLHHYDKSYSIEHNILFEKNYVRFQDSEEYQDSLTEEISEIDLFNIMDNFNIQLFCLYDIIQFLSSFQVENIIIIDFSCSDFKDLNTEKKLSDRDIRAIRRNWIK